MDIVSTPGGGLIAAWIERSSSGDQLLCAQRINQDGTHSWASDAVLVDRAPGDISLHAVIADAGGGAFFYWQRDSVLLIQHLDAAGAPLLDPGSMLLGSTTHDTFRVKSDGKGGILISDRTSVRRYAADHSEPWTGQSVIFYNDPTPGTLAEVIPDGKGGAFAVWNLDTWVTGAQWIDSTGRRRWDGGIILLAVAGYDLTVLPSPPYEAPTAFFILDARRFDGYGRRHFFTFVDTLDMIRTGTAPAATIAKSPSIDVSPSPVHDHAAVQLVLDRPSSVRLDVVDLLGRRVWTLVESDLPSGTHAVNADFSALPCGTHFLVLRTGTAFVTRRIAVVR